MSKNDKSIRIKNTRNTTLKTGKSPKHHFRLFTVIIVIVAIALSAIIAVNSNKFFSDLVSSDNVESENVSNYSDALKKQFPAYFEQNIIWKPCTNESTAGAATGPANFDCADVKVPLNWGYPTDSISPDYQIDTNHFDSNFTFSVQESLTIKLNKSGATGVAKGDIFTNPGGPGASGVDFLSQLVSAVSPNIKTAYNLIGFDPRGVERSNPIKCYDNEQTQYDDNYDTTFILPDDKDKIETNLNRFASDCKRLSGDILSFVDTESVSADLNLFRALLKDDKLNYMGFSYGTSIGYTYLGMFPETTGKILLDGVVNPTLTMEQDTIQQAGGFENTLTKYLDNCISTNAKCPFSGSTDDAKKAIREFLDTLHSQPGIVAKGSDRKLTDTLAFIGILSAMYNSANWPVLSLAFTEYKNLKTGNYFAMLADNYTDYKDGKFTTNIFEANSAVNCDDQRDYTYSWDDTLATNAEVNAATPTFTYNFGFNGYSCSVLPKANYSVQYDKSAPNSSNVILVGTLNDPATPYSGAVAMSESLKNSTLVTVDASSHCSYLYNFPTLTKLVDDYFLNDKTPDKGITIKENTAK